MQAASRLTHPNLAAPLGSGEDRGVTFVVMSYSEGSGLERVVRERGPLRLDQAVDILVQAVRGWKRPTPAGSSTAA